MKTPRERVATLEAENATVVCRGEREVADVVWRLTPRYPGAGSATRYVAFIGGFLQPLSDAGRDVDGCFRARSRRGAFGRAYDYSTGTWDPFDSPEEALRSIGYEFDSIRSAVHAELHAERKD